LASRDGQNPSSGAGPPYERSAPLTNHAEEKIGPQFRIWPQMRKKDHSSQETFLSDSVQAELSFVATTLAREDSAEHQRRAARQLQQ
jgi:hypothetical protein